jgi:2-polyprenyl-3-methyl-5-hydroxy-6-metoxy-1,4-benzoquinol methylase
MSDELVKEFYSSQVRQEWRRLVMNAYHKLELDTTLHYLEKYLPSRGLVLDAGGGPGRYTLELARRGYEVMLLDATQANLEFARRMVRRYGIQKQVKEITLGSIVDLSRYADGTFDAVVCTGGPLSHILDPLERNQAIDELVRVLKPKAPLFVSVMSRLAVLRVILIESQVEVGMPHFNLLRDTGDYLGERGFTACHFYLPEELLREFTRQGIEILEMVGLEGISSSHIKELNRLAKDTQRYQFWLDTHYQTCTHPAVVGTSEHMLIVCRKNEQPGTSR